MKKIRLFFIILFFASLYSLLFFNIYTLQIQKGGYYSARAASQHRLAGFLDPRRGNIYFTDRNGNSIPAAMIKAYPMIFAVPKEISDPGAVASALSPAIGMTEEKLLTLLDKPGDPYELLIRKASNGQVQEIRELGIKGIYIDEENSRLYPFGKLASHILGFVGPTAEDDQVVGRYGLEFFYNEKLEGESGRLEGERIIDPVDGNNIHLTIDSNIQTRAEEILSNLIQHYKAEGGMVIVQDPTTGKILAMGSFPNFDPNSYSDYRLKSFLNPVIQSVYEPGSVMKVITMAAGLDAGKLTPETTFFDSGSLVLDGRTIKNWDLKANGKVTMTEIIERSINTGAAYAGKLVGKDIFYNYLVNFGFGASTGIKLLGEVSGSLENLKKSARDINFATAAFGQGVSVTPMQMIGAFSAIANKGVLMEPQLIREETPKAVRRVISEEAAREATGMMVSAVSKAVIAQIPKFDIAGKTGTAQIPNFQSGGYSDEYIHTFIGFAPAYSPRFTILIRIDKPYGAPLAGLTVVPAFRELSEFILNYYNVPPDHLE